MTLAPHPRSTAADLLRVLALWLAAILLVQGIAAARALGLGPLHRHATAAAQGLHHHHDGAERHHHAADASVQALASPEAGHDAAAFALVAALALMAFAVARTAPDRRRHVRRAAIGWSWRTCLLPPPQRPPRPA